MLDGFTALHRGSLGGVWDGDGGGGEGAGEDVNSSEGEGDVFGAPA